MAGSAMQTPAMQQHAHGGFRQDSESGVRTCRYAERVWLSLPVQVFGFGPDETAYFRLVLFKVPVLDAVVSWSSATFVTLQLAQCLTIQQAPSLVHIQRSTHHLC